METVPFGLLSKGVHDPAWWWAEASNLRASSDAVVRFNLAHVFVWNVEFQDEILDVSHVSTFKLDVVGLLSTHLEAVNLVHF
mmetsp:Transcript_24714/g.38833  ORF Transcript_24714/g.38833 Transcript_24714/m.38833 type:complete len:82 (-) Transcript_24714:431-676(-)